MQQNLAFFAPRTRIGLRFPASAATADIGRRGPQVAFVPSADSCAAEKTTRVGSPLKSARFLGLRSCGPIAVSTSIISRFGLRLGGSSTGRAVAGTVVGSFIPSITLTGPPVCAPPHPFPRKRAPPQTVRKKTWRHPEDRGRKHLDHPEAEGGCPQGGSARSADAVVTD